MLVRVVLDSASKPEAPITWPEFASEFLSLSSLVVHPRVTLRWSSSSSSSQRSLKEDVACSDAWFGRITDEVITAELNTKGHMMDGYKVAQQPRPYVKILVQPQGRALRFRYKCEGRYPGSLTGFGSTAETKTYPTIRVSFRRSIASRQCSNSFKRSDLGNFKTTRIENNCYRDKLSVGLASPRLTSRRFSGGELRRQVRRSDFLRHQRSSLPSASTQHRLQGELQAGHLPNQVQVFQYDGAVHNFRHPVREEVRRQRKSTTAPRA